MLRMKLVIIAVLLVAARLCVAGVPGMINYQGKLLQPSGVPVADGTYAMRFAIYDRAVESDPPTPPIWSETNPSVQVKGGLYSVLLGSVTPIPDSTFGGPNRWFGIKVGSDLEMTPRQQIASVAYAQVAGTVPPASITADKLAAGVAIPPGLITMWSGATNQIPQGWALCDGTNGTPDLRNRFIVGVGAEYAVGATGGEKFHQLTAAEMPSHSHYEVAAKTNGYGGVDGTVAGSGYDKGSHWASYLTVPAGGDQPHENRPPYYALCFIMKVAY